jgi:anaerobic magnesium-protoporphyrin IX monomethyl ester cyclase
MYLDPKQVQHAQPYPPLGTIWAAALLREHGYEVQLFDTMFVKDPSTIQEVLQEFKPDIVVIYDDGFNYLTKMCLSNMRHAAFQMQHIAKQYYCKVIVSSSDATDHAESYLAQKADVVILGEAEYTLLDLVNHYNSTTGNINDIQGIVYKSDNGLMKTLRRPVIKNLDDLPLPAWDIVNITPYRNMWLAHRGYFSLNMATTRGCPYKCNWCAKPIYGNAYHMRSAAKVVAELKWVKELFKIDHIWFADDIFGLKRSWVKEFALLVLQQNLKTPFKIQSRADLLIQENYVSDLATAGCTEIWMGAESGSQKVLDAMDKGTSVEQIRAARSLLKKHHVRAAFFLQYGYPGETKEDISLTLNLLRETMPDDIGISVSYPLPGTEFYERVKGQLQEKVNWEHSDDMEIMFEQTYSKEFYRKLHKYTHYFFRLEQTKQQDLNISKYFRMLKYALKKKYYHTLLK